MTNRDPRFDKLLVDYLPGLRRRAGYFVKDKVAAEELVQETVMTMLERSESCRVETFKTWAQYVMFSVWGDKQKSSQRIRRTPRPMGGDVSIPNQEESAELAQTLSLLRSLRDGDILLRRAMGDELTEIGRERGVSREAIRQRQEIAISKLRKRVRMRRAVA